jgi:hypothetical protein
VAEVLRAGTLKLPTGRLLAVSPSWLPPLDANHVGPFTVTVAPGAYPVDLALLRWSNLRVAAARLTITDQPVTRWEMGLRAGRAGPYPGCRPATSTAPAI